MRGDGDVEIRASRDGRDDPGDDGLEQPHGSFGYRRHYRQQLADLKTHAGIANVAIEYDSIPIVEVDVARPEQLASLHRNPYVCRIALEPALASIDPSPTGVSTAGAPSRCRP